MFDELHNPGLGHLYELLHDPRSRGLAGAGNTPDQHDEHDEAELGEGDAAAAAHHVPPSSTPTALKCELAAASSSFGAQVLLQLGLGGCGCEEP